MPDRTPPRHDCPNCGPGEPGPSTTETVRGGRRLRTPGRTKTGPTIASEQISVAATTDTTRDNNPACDVLRMRLTRVLDECRSTYIPGDQAALVLAELAPELDELADYRNRITWETNCGEHARLLDSAYAETVRAETAEAAIARVEAELDRTDRMLGTDSETFATAAGARIHAQRIRAALNPPADTEATP